ncbi:MAG: hypothetical protein AB1762_04045 [Gemmatimonadota bacterium]
MRSVFRSCVWSAIALATAATAAMSQPAGLRSARTEAPIAVQGRGGSPTLTLYGGLASGDNAFDMGPALAASFNWRISDAPFNFRVDPYFAYHGVENGDGSLWLLGALANLELAFRASGTTAEPFITGGAGFYFRNLSLDFGDEEIDDSSLEGAFGFGGGVRFSGFTLEARLQDIDEFTTVAFLVGFRLGG